MVFKRVKNLKYNNHLGSAIWIKQETEEGNKFVYGSVEVFLKL